MCIKRMLMLCTILFCCCLNFSSAQQVKQVTFRGIVVDDQDSPVAGAKTVLYDIHYGRLQYTYNNDDIIEKTSDADGKFSFSIEVSSDDYSFRFIVVEKEGFAMDCKNWYVNQTETEGRFKLSSPKELSGSVVDKSGQPISGSSVSVLMMRIGDPQDNHSMSVNVAPKLLNTVTDENGKFSFANLPSDAGVAFLIQKEGRATVSTYVPGAPASETYKFSPGQENIRIVQPEESRIEGVAIDTSSGKPLAGMPLMLRANNNYQVMGQDVITTAENGQFSMKGICAGTYNIIYVAPRDEPADWLAQPVNFNIEVGQTKEDVIVELIKGGLLEIHVTEAGSQKPLMGARVWIINERTRESKAQRTDKNGIASIRLLPGVYQSGQAVVEGYSSFMQQESISIEDGRTKRLDWQLEPMPKASGVVLDEEGKQVEGANIYVMPGGSSRDIESDSEGKFEISWNTEMFSDERENPLLVCRYEERNLAKVVILEGSTENLEVKLQPGITVSGKVVDPEGKGIDNAGIRMMLRQTMWASTLIRGDTTKTNAEGNFEVKAIPAEYRYQITASADGYGSQQKDVHADDAVDNILDAGEFTLALANLSVTGVVVDAEGNPISNARIESYNFDGGQPDNLRTQTDSQGNFALKGVCEGKVDIRVNAVINGIAVSARASADGGLSDIKIIARERGQYITQHFTNKTYEQIIQGSEKVIAGIVVDENDLQVAGVPVGVNCIKREREDAPGKFMWSFSSYEDLSSTTDKQGRFAIALKEDVQYDLIFSPNNYAAMLVYDIPAGKKDLKVILPKGGTISGRLVRVDNGKKVPISNAQVKLEQTDRASYTHLGFDRDRSTVTDSQGRFKFEHIQTEIRPHASMSQSEWEFVPRVWQLVYGDNVKTFAFYDRQVIDNFEFLFEPDLTNPQSMKGRALPGFEGIKIDFDEEKVKSKILLVCFFDIEQRPSRSCLLQLSQKLSQLKEKNVEIIAIHASKIEREYLDNWLKENNIFIPAGIVDSNEEQIRFNWGVKALPWLILTDGKHIVSDEGFSINELDEKIQN